MTATYTPTPFTRDRGRSWNHHQSLTNGSIDPDKIVQKASLVSIEQSGYAVSRKLTDTERQHALTLPAQTNWKGSNRDTVKGSKYFIDPHYYKPVADFMSETHRQLKDYSQGVTWTQGVHLVKTDMLLGSPSLGIPDLRSWIIDRETQLEQRAADFRDIYDQAVAEAQAALGPLYDSGDYKSKEEVYSQIGMKIHVSSIPKGVYEHLAIDESFMPDLDSKHQERIKEAAKDSVKTLIEDMTKAVKNMASNLEHGKNMHNSSIEGLHSLGIRVPAMDLTDDPQVKSLADRIVSELTLFGAATKDTFKSEATAKETLESAKSIGNDLDEYAELLN